MFRVLRGRAEGHTFIVELAITYILRKPSASNISKLENYTVGYFSVVSSGKYLNARAMELR